MYRDMKVKRRYNKFQKGSACLLELQLDHVYHGQAYFKDL
jgi:hypothetical protein